MSNLEYNGQVLTTARCELKLKADDIATELCLSVEQVKSIENNLGKSFKKYLYIFLAAFITTLAWKFFA
jgi:cytoskeletal protein RodZ